MGGVGRLKWLSIIHKQQRKGACGKHYLNKIIHRSSQFLWIRYAMSSCMFLWCGFWYMTSNMGCWFRFENLNKIFNLSIKFSSIIFILGQMSMPFFNSKRIIQHTNTWCVNCPWMIKIIWAKFKNYCEVCLTFKKLAEIFPFYNKLP